MADIEKPAIEDAKSVKTMKGLLSEILPTANDVSRVLAYVNGEIRKEAATLKRNPDASTPVTNNSVEQVVSLVNKFWNLGLVVDGVNVVITGVDMAMVTYHGYKNKVIQTYPSATFDVQLVREGDTFKVSKKDGKVSYSHDIGDPFEASKIRGAYCVIKIDNQDYFEALNREDYDKMRNSSKQSFLWDKWESEFVLKSVIKRACKRHFNDAIADIEKIDNEDYGSVSSSEPQKKSDDGKLAAQERSRRAIEKAQEIANADS